MILPWLTSRTVREAVELRRRVRRLLRAQRDQVSSEASSAIGKASDELRAALRRNAPVAELRASMKHLEDTGNRWLHGYPYPGIRENVDVLLVALAVALAIRTFFLQPMAIPTGSMQPTLFGITHLNLKEHPELKIPGFFARWAQSWFLGTKYYQVTAAADGVFQGAEEPRQIFPFVKKQRFVVGNRPYDIWFPPDELFGGVNRSGLVPGQAFKAGEDIIKLRVTSGDRLFADRLTYNFRRPRRGEIVIFASTGIPHLTQGTHYIKRLIGLGGETIRLGNDRHVIVNGRRLDASTPRFENLYTFQGPPETDKYSGHVNDEAGRQAAGRSTAPLFPNEQAEFSVPAREYFVLGDNTMNSYDSRYWGSFPREKVIGKFFFVFWPFSERFGWAVQ